MKQGEERRILNGKELTLGMCYYPEQWDRKLWSEDLQRMKELGIRMIRIADFAWTIFEPEEDCFCFDLFDDFLELAQEADMQILFCTPTAAPPAWLTEKYPEVLNARIDGVLYRHGMRRHYNYNSEIYQALCGRLVKKLAEHFGKRSCIAGWQIDNELNCAMDEFYSESDDAAFRIFLMERYKNLGELNKAWGTVFWNQTYTDWKQVHLPGPTVYRTASPHQKLDYIRFISDSAIRFCRMQSRILREYIKETDFITSNGIFENLDSHRMKAECLDVFCYDSYPGFAFTLKKKREQMADRKWSRNLTLMRSVNPHFGITEQQAGAGGWATGTLAPAPHPGQMMLWTMQSILHGADHVGFFRWRTSVMGTEIYWQGILDWDNQENRRMEELAHIASRVRRISRTSGSTYVSQAALVRDYDNLWDARVDAWHGKLHQESERSVFEEMQRTHTPMDMLNLTDHSKPEELGRYRLLFYPHPYILTQERTKLLAGYVQNGGILVIGAGTGMKDLSGKCVMLSGPGFLSAYTGSIVKERTLAEDGEDPVRILWNGQHLETGSFRESLSIADSGRKPGREKDEVQVLGVYESGDYRQSPALIRTSCGDGRIYHLGGSFTPQMVRLLLAETDCLSPLGRWADAPECCELALKEKGGKRWLFVLNYSSGSVMMKLQREAEDLDTGRMVSGEIKLAAYETKVYELPCS